MIAYVIITNMIVMMQLFVYGLGTLFTGKQTNQTTKQKSQWIG